jgi:hypothetical protein
LRRAIDQAKLKAAVKRLVERDENAECADCAAKRELLETVAASTGSISFCCLDSGQATRRMPRPNTMCIGHRCRLSVAMIAWACFLAGGTFET